MIKNIVIVGGGTAGWSTAHHFINKTHPDTKITVVATPEIPIIGVGESTTGRFNDLIKIAKLSNINENEFLKDYYSEVKAKRKKDEITLPSSIKKELSINPFLRLSDENIISNASNFASINLVKEVDTLKTIREWKDNF